MEQCSAAQEDPSSQGPSPALQSHILPAHPIPDRDAEPVGHTQGPWTLLSLG